MKKALSFLPAVLLLVLATSCVTTKGEATPTVAGSGDRFTANSVLMTAGADWGPAVTTAEFAPGITQDGVESIEARVKYGETTAVWNFSGLPPRQTVEASFMLNADFFQSDAFLEAAYLPGTYTAKDGLWPREAIRAAVKRKWIDSVGRFAGSDWPDSTDGWQKVTYSEARADEHGNFTVVMIFNHYTENPPIVFFNFTNPEVKALAK